MGGASIPSSFFGGGTTGGTSIGYSGGQGLGGTQAAVANPTKPGALMAYNPGTMATSLTPANPLPQALDIANSGTSDVGMTGANQQSALGSLVSLPSIPAVNKAATAAPAAAKKVSGATGATGTTPAAASATGNGNYTLIPMNAAGGYNQPGIQQPMAVGDFWSGQGNYTAAVQRQGNAPQLISNGIFTDNKGGYFARDPSGKIVPLAGNQLKQTQKFFQGWGYS